MSINLVSILSQYMTPELIGRISSTLGVDKTLLGKAAVALAPTLLRVLSGLASTPLGAQRLAGAVEKQGSGVLGSLESGLAGVDIQSIAKGGLGTLESLLGGSALAGLTGAIAKYSGLGEEATSGLFGLAAPATLGVLHKEQQANGLDASGLSRLLESQKDYISAAMPQGLENELAKTGVPGFAPAAYMPASSPRPAAPPPIDPAVRAPQGFPWRLPLAAAVAAIALAAYFFSGTSKPVVEQTKPVEPARTTSSGGLPSLAVDGVDLKASVQKAFAGLSATLQGVTDTASAQSALPKLQKEGFEFDKLKDLASKLPFEGRTAFASLVSELRPQIEAVFNKVLAIPGVAAVAQPVIDGLRTRLDALSSKA